MEHVIRVWNRLGSLRLSIWLFVLLALNLSIGYLCLDGRTVVFQPMNDVGLAQWLRTYGVNQFPVTAWFFLLLPLLLVLAVNTLICTTSKLYLLVPNLLSRSFINTFRLTLSIHVIHLGVVVMLAGYLVSYSLGTMYPGITINLHNQADIPGSPMKLSLTELELIPYTSDRISSFTDRYIDAEARILVRSPGKNDHEVVVALNRPGYVQGYTLLLKRFNPGSVGGMRSARYIVLDIRRDFGGIVTLWGMGAFMAGLLGYLIHRTMAGIGWRPKK